MSAIPRPAVLGDTAFADAAAPPLRAAAADDDASPRTRALLRSDAFARIAMAATRSSEFDGMSGEQIKASVYGAAGDLKDDRISPEEMTAIVADAAPRLDEEQRSSLAALLRVKLDEDVAEDVVRPLTR